MEKWMAISPLTVRRVGLGRCGTAILAVLSARRMLAKVSLTAWPITYHIYFSDLCNTHNNLWPRKLDTAYILWYN